MHFERAQRVLIVSGREDHRHFPADQLEHLEAVQLRHLHVEKHQIGVELRHRLDGIEAVAALGHHLDARMCGDVLADHRPRQRLVVHDHDAKTVVGHAPSSAGIETSTRHND